MNILTRLLLILESAVESVVNAVVDRIVAEWIEAGEQ